MRNYKHLAGPDASIDISLLEYGLAWFADPASEDIEFFYGIRQQNDDNDDYTCFDNGTFPHNLDPEKEWDWADLDAVSNFAGMSRKEFLSLPLTQMVQDMLSYYGYENVFGSTYWGEWHWNKNLQRFQREHPADVLEVMIACSSSIGRHFE